MQHAHLAYLPWHLIICLGAGLGAAGCSREAEKPPPPPAALPVQVARVERQVLPRAIEVPGTVRPVDRARLAARLMGEVVSIPVAIGQHVRRGETLLEIAANEIEARLAQAEARLDRVKRDYEREHALLSEGASTEASVRALESDVRAAQAAVSEARTLLGYTHLTAPFDGVITARLANEGDLAAPGAHLLSIEGTDRMRVETEVPESLGHLRPGDSIALRISGIEMVGVLAEISSSADTQSRTVLARIDLPPGTAARSGQFARARFPADKSAALLLPASAVSRFGQIERVFTVREDRASLRLVRVGDRTGDRVEILAGLSEGELVVIDPPAPLRDGQSVIVDSR